jgi:hypothetical protein
MIPNGIIRRQIALIELLRSIRSGLKPLTKLDLRQSSIFFIIPAHYKASVTRIMTHRILIPAAFNI